jgi:hypothetical protein
VVFGLCVDLLLTGRVYGRVRNPALASGAGGGTGERNVDLNLGVDFGHGGGGGGLNTTAKGIGIGGGQETGMRGKEKLYIASIHWNSATLLSAHWIPALLSLVKQYGASNLYISIFESGSWDETKSLLRSLDSQLEGLGVERRIVLEEKTHEEEVNREPREGEKGWVWGRGRREMRRIPFLARARNRAVGPLRELALREGREKRVFDRVVWLNDVIFTVCLSAVPSILQYEV